MKLKELKKGIGKSYFSFDEIWLDVLKDDGQYFSAWIIIEDNYSANYNNDTMFCLPNAAWKNGKSVSEKQIDNKIRYAMKVCNYERFDINEKQNQLHIKFIPKDLKLINV